jgi:hypothetical protein
MKNHVLDGDRLIAKVVWHAPVKQGVLNRALPRPHARGVPRVPPWRPSAARGLPWRDHPREIVNEIDSPWRSARAAS